MKIHLSPHSPLAIIVTAGLICGTLSACVEQKPSGDPAEVGEGGSSSSSASSVSVSSNNAVSVSTSSSDGNGSSSSASSSESRSNGARSLSEETDDYTFEYSYPAEAGNIPQLAAELDSRLERERGELARSAAEGRSDARANGFPFNQYSQHRRWQTVTDLPDWISLSGPMSHYLGGAHGNSGISSLVWDKQGGNALKGMDVFASPNALKEAVGEQYCAELDKQRVEMRGAPLDRAEGQFAECPSFSDLVILLGSSNGTSFDRITLYAAPYVAGPYVEGDYEVHLPVDAAVIEAVKPEYQASFSSAQ